MTVVRYRRSLGGLALAAAAALGAWGCGSGAPRGRVVFAQLCSSCHSLIGNDSLHKQGGDLVGYRISRAALLQFAREMPTRRPLTQAELRAVVDYVQRAESARR